MRQRKKNDNNSQLIGIFITDKRIDKIKGTAVDIHRDHDEIVFYPIKHRRCTCGHFFRSKEKTAVDIFSLDSFATYRKQRLCKRHSNIVDAFVVYFMIK